MLKGDLEDFPLGDLLRLLSMTARSGQLWLDHEGTIGRVELVEGLLHDASFSLTRVGIARRLLGRRVLPAETLQEVLARFDHTPTDVEVAHAVMAGDLAPAGSVLEVLERQLVGTIFELMQWPGGTFRFDAEVPVAQLSVHEPLPLGEVLDEVESRLERWPSLLERTGDGSDSVTIGHPVTEAVGLDADGCQLLWLADGQRTVRELEVLSGLGRFATRRTLVNLLELGVVRLGAPQDADRLAEQHRALVELEEAWARSDDATSPPGEDQPSPGPTAAGGLLDPRPIVGVQPR